MLIIEIISAPVKLAFCLPEYFPYGGLQNNCLRIAESLLARGHSVDLYTRDWQGPVPRGCRVRVVEVRALRNHSKNVAFARKFAQAMEAGRYDGVVGFMKIPSLDVYYAADPCFQTRAKARRFWLYRLSGRYRALVALERSVFEPDAGTEILMLAEREIDNYVRCYATPQERFHLLPPAVPRDRMAGADALEVRNALRAEFSVGPDEMLLLSVGSGFKTKGVDRTIRALAALPGRLGASTSLMVVGQGDPGPFERLARRLGVGDRVRFLGGRTDVRRFLFGADLLVHPAYSENTGNVLLEAMVAGLPVLTTANCGYAPRVERAGGGRVVPEPFAQERLNAALSESLERGRLEEWSRNGIDYGRNEDLYSRPETAADIIESVIEVKAAARR